jgi:hypothetical protein
VTPADRRDTLVALLVLLFVLFLARYFPALERTVDVPDYYEVKP